MKKRTRKRFQVYDGEHSYQLELWDRITDKWSGKEYDGTIVPPRDGKVGKILWKADQSSFDRANTAWHETVHMAEIAEENLILTDDQVILLGRYFARLFRNTPAYGQMLLDLCKRDE